MQRSFFLSATLVLCALSLHAQTEDYTRKLKKMFEVSGTEQAYQAAIDQTLNITREQYPEVDQEFWTELRAEFRQTSIDDLTEMLAPVYNKYLSETDLDDIIAFYSSTAGKKLAASNPMIMQESMQIGQQWGALLGERVINRVMEQKN